jgi:hypothetical protein
MQNQVTEEDRLRCLVGSKCGPRRIVRHLELKRTQKHMMYSRCMGFGWLFNMQEIDIK